jgi:cytochrome c biogenesis protein CcmG/thiol:disulfide interchange protein DsbE
MTTNSMETTPQETAAQEAAAEQAEVQNRPRWGRIIVWVGLLALLAILAFGLLRTQQGPVGVNQSAPSFVLTTFDGEEISSIALQDKIIVVNFWASWCKPCEQEAADLEAAWRYYQPGGEVVFLGVDYVDTEPEARAYLEKFQISYPNGPDLGTRISQAFRIQGVPETYIIDTTNTLRFVRKGPFRNLAEIKAAIDPLLKE